MANDITILSCPQCGFPKIRDCGNGLYQCDDCGTHFDKNENIVQTNEQYIHSLNTEQLAEYLADKFNEVVDFVLHEVDENAGDIEPDDYWYRQSVVAEWLKEIHTGDES